jgi:protein arginine kinase activator
MKCESCHKAEATVQVKQVADGMVKEVFLCAECAENSGLKSPSAVADFLFGFSGSKSASEPVSDENKRCPSCSMSLSEFNKHSRPGCENCYETFAVELLPMIDDMHRAVKHIGKAPARESSGAEIEKLKAELIKAVQEQAFEDAAQFRDRIKALETP